MPDSAPEQSIAVTLGPSKDVVVGQTELVENETTQRDTAPVTAQEAQSGRDTTRDEEHHRSSGPTDISSSSHDHPCQPQLLRYPAQVSANGKLRRSFNISYYGKHPWLEYSVKENSVFCFCCRHFGGTSTLRGQRYGARPFIETGVRRWKDISSVLEEHAKSDRHRDSAVSWTKFKAIQAKEMQPIASVLSTDRNKEMNENREHVKALLKVTALLGRLGTAFRSHDETESSANKGHFVETCNLLAEYSPTLFNKLQRRYGHYTSHEYQNDLISVIGSRLRSTIVQEVKRAKYFAVLVDETKDNSKKEQLAILLRYFDEGKVRERPIGCYHMKSLDAESLASFIHDTVAKLGLDWNYCVAQCYDGASVMSGPFSGVQARLRAKAPQAIYIHCHAHRLNLVIANCVEGVGTVGSFFSLVQNLYTFISNSNTRHQLFVESQKATQLPVLELERSAATRWSYWYRSISKIRLRYECVLAVLSAVSEGADSEARAEAAGLQRKMESFTVIFQLLYMEAILRTTNSLSEQLQAVDLVISRSRTLIQATRKEIAELRSDTSFASLLEKAKEFAEGLEIEVPDVNGPATGSSSAGQKGRPRRTQKIIKHLKEFMTTSTLGKNFVESDNRAPTLAEELKREYLETVDRLIAEFDRRFTDNLPVLSTLEALDPSSTKFMDAGLLKQFSELYSEMDIDQILLEAQAGIAKRFLLEEEAKPKNFMDVIDNIETLPVAYSEIIKVLHIAATLPVTTASNERLFSGLEIVKNYLRSTTGDDRLSHLLLIFAEKDLVKNLDFDQLVDDFAKMKPRRFPLLP